MGKFSNPNLHKKQIGIGVGDASWTIDGIGVGVGNSGIFCDRCSLRLRRLCDHFSFKCALVSILGFAAFLSWIFWILPASRGVDVRYDAPDSVQRSATIQASFKLQKGVPELIMNIKRLEYDIYGEISVPDTKVVVLSMHKSESPGCTNVVFGVLSNSSTSPINPVDQSLLRSLFIELFLQQSNLTLTAALFGQTSDFEILVFPGGLTVIPANSASIWKIPNILFNFILNNSITEIQENSFEFREQLKHGLRLGSHENIYVQVSNKNGSTVYPQVTVHASVMSDLGILLPDRLKELATVIATFRAKNLGLDYMVFGDVKSVSLSSYMRESIEAASPTPSPAPSPGPNGEPPSPSSAPPVSHPYISRPKRPPAHPKGNPSPAPAPAPHLPPKNLKSQFPPAFPPSSGGNLVSSEASRVLPFPAAVATQNPYAGIWVWGALVVIFKVMF
ncbi:hypothetical protein MLD38_033996 [Melastoma candidum]|uniref:Uncharacterized protein n=1 Tax=Melastoma candidum TaxID=119954 RepID=A0ACB9MCW9_9MYRT|nr:hypothetical protein MLD38_033996 [Melastoma candidum]